MSQSSNKPVVNRGDKKVLMVIPGDNETYGALKNMATNRKDMSQNHIKWPMVMIYDIKGLYTKGHI